jgi:hypothetical protein
MALAWLPATALAAAAEDIRDIRGPKSSSATWPMVAAVAAAILLVLAAWLIWRRRQGDGKGRMLSLAERTLHRLEGLRPLMRPVTARAFSIAASEQIRLYTEEFFHVATVQRTTEEFLQSLLQTSDEALVRHRPLLTEFLNRCDLVKFAGDSLTENDMELLLQSARRFVLETSAASAG